MSAGLVAAVVACAVAIVAVRRRSSAIALVALQSVLLAALALDHGVGDSAQAIALAVALTAKAILLPGALVRLTLRTRERSPVPPVGHASGRLALAAAVVLPIVALAPDAGLAEHGQDGALALVLLGVSIAVLHRAAVLQAIALLVAENGAYLAALAVPGGIPVVIEVGLVVDLVLVLAVAVTFSDRIHAEHGTGDTGRLRELHDRG